jgi:hypothetical protein
MSASVAATDVYGSGDGGEIWDHSTIRGRFSTIFGLISTFFDCEFRPSLALA